MQVSVVVHDRDGRPVSDLKKEDFTVTERGKPQQISVFNVQSSDAPAPPPPALPPQDAAGVDETWGHHSKPGHDA